MSWRCSSRLNAPAGRVLRHWLSKYVFVPLQCFSFSFIVSLCDLLIDLVPALFISSILHFFSWYFPFRSHVLFLFRAIFHCALTFPLFVFLNLPHLVGVILFPLDICFLSLPSHSSLSCLFPHSCVLRFFSFHFPWLPFLSSLIMSRDCCKKWPHVWYIRWYLTLPLFHLCPIRITWWPPHSPLAPPLPRWPRRTKPWRDRVRCSCPSFPSCLKTPRLQPLTPSLTPLLATTQLILARSAAKSRCCWRVKPRSQVRQTCHSLLIHCSQILYL